jgi:hypothetical protein
MPPLEKMLGYIFKFIFQASLMFVGNPKARKIEAP